MDRGNRSLTILTGSIALLLAGCAPRTIDFSQIERPPRAPELDAYDVFVGEWDWEAEVLNAEGADRNWTGQAQWMWTLDQRCLHGTLQAQSPNAEFEAAGIWSWHPNKKQYLWWMFNDWGYPQQGTATYDAGTKTWNMPFVSVGLDGTPSHGQYTMRVVNNDLLEWEVVEWADALHTVKKLEMQGKYRRRE